MNETPTHKNYLVGYFQIEGTEGQVSAETELTGNAEADYRRLYGAVGKKYPGARVRRVGSTVESRPLKDPGPIDSSPGMTLRNVFVEGTEEESFRNIGSVFFDGQNCDVFLRYVRVKGTVGILLVDKLTKSPIRFTNQINAGYPVEDLPKLIAEVLGPNFKELKLRLAATQTSRTQPVPPKVPASPVKAPEAPPDSLKAPISAPVETPKSPLQGRGDVLGKLEGKPKLPNYPV